MIRQNIKKAQGHVEMIISFLLFTSAVVIIFIFINPLGKIQTNNYSEEKVKNAFIQSASLDVKKFIVIVNADNGCYNLSSDLQDNFIEVQKSPKEYALYFEDSFNKQHPHLDINCPVGTYTVIDYLEEQLIFYPKLKELKASYDSDYRTLKDTLGITKDFSFNFVYLNQTKIDDISVEKETPKGKERTSINIPVRLIDENGILQEVILNIRAW